MDSRPVDATIKGRTVDVSNDSTDRVTEDISACLPRLSSRSSWRRAHNSHRCIRGLVQGNGTGETVACLIDQGVVLGIAVVDVIEGSNRSMRRREGQEDVKKKGSKSQRRDPQARGRSGR